MERLLEAIASRSPAPGGGAAVAVAGALAAAVAGMVVEYSVGEEDTSASAEALRHARQVLARARALFVELADADAAAYQALREAKAAVRKGPADADRHRQAVRAALDVPRTIAGTAINVLRVLESIAPLTRRSLRSDQDIAAVLAEAAAIGGARLVETNLGELDDAAAAAALVAELAETRRQARQRRAAVESAAER